MKKSEIGTKEKINNQSQQFGPQKPDSLVNHKNMRPNNEKINPDKNPRNHK